MWMGGTGQEDVDGWDMRLWKVGCMRDVKKRRRRNMKGGGGRTNLEGVGVAEDKLYKHFQNFMKQGEA